jgi:hypothetical protein
MALLSSPARAKQQAHGRKNCCPDLFALNETAALRDQVSTSSHGLILSRCGGYQHLPRADESGFAFCVGLAEVNPKVPQWGARGEWWTGNTLTDGER